MAVVGLREAKKAAECARNIAMDFDLDELSPDVLNELGTTKERLVVEAAIDMGFEYDDGCPVWL